MPNGEITWQTAPDDPDFQGMSSYDKRVAMTRLLDRDPDFKAMERADQDHARNQILAKYTDTPPTPSYSGKPELKYIGDYGNLKFSGHPSDAYADNRLLAEINNTATTLGFNLGVSSASRPGSVTKSGYTSRHAYGHALDISTINGQSVLTPQGRQYANALYEALASKGYTAGEHGDNKGIIWGPITGNIGGNHMNHIHVSLPRNWAGELAQAALQPAKPAPFGAKKPAAAKRRAPPVAEEPLLQAATLPAAMQLPQSAMLPPTGLMPPRKRVGPVAEANEALDALVAKANQKAEAYKREHPVLHTLGVVNSFASNILPGIAGGEAPPPPRKGKSATRAEQTQWAFKYPLSEMMGAMFGTELYNVSDDIWRRELAKRPLAERMAIHSELGTAMLGPEQARIRQQLVRQMGPAAQVAEAAAQTGAGLASNLFTYGFPGIGGVSRLPGIPGAVGRGVGMAGTVGFTATQVKDAVDIAKNPDIPVAEKAAHLALLGLFIAGGTVGMNREVQEIAPRFIPGWKDMSASVRSRILKSARNPEQAAAEAPPPQEVPGAAVQAGKVEGADAQVVRPGEARGVGEGRSVGEGAGREEVARGVVEEPTRAREEAQVPQEVALPVVTVEQISDAAGHPRSEVWRQSIGKLPVIAHRPNGAMVADAGNGKFIYIDAAGSEHVTTKAAAMRSLRYGQYGNVRSAKPLTDITEVKQPTPTPPVAAEAQVPQEVVPPAAGMRTGGSLSPDEAVRQRRAGEWDNYLLTQARVKEDAYAARTQYAVPEPEGDSVTVYRAAPTNVTAIEPGDYVTPSRAYAENHLRRHLTGELIENPELVGGGKIVSAVIPKSDLGVAGASELIYVPTERRAIPISEVAPPVAVPEGGRYVAPATEGMHEVEGPSGMRYETHETGAIVRLPIADIKSDPARFQYKRTANVKGTTGELTDVPYNPNLAGIISVWRDSATGETFVVNGHNRLEQARQQGVTHYNAQYIDVPTAAEARMVGALQNIAEGHGTPIDAATIFRESGITPEDLTKQGVSLKAKLAADGLALSKLPEHLWRRIQRYEMPIARGVAIGGSNLNQGQQLALSQLIDKMGAKGQRLTDAEIGELARFVSGAGETTTGQETLFDEEALKQSNAVEKARLAAWLKDELARDKRIFKPLAQEERAREVAARTGAELPVEEARQIAESAERVREMFDRFAYRTGPIADALNDAARKLAGGSNEQAVKSYLKERVATSLQAIIRGGEEPRVAGPEEAAGPGAPGSLFAEPGPPAEPTVAAPSPMQTRPTEPPAPVATTTAATEGIAERPGWTIEPTANGQHFAEHSSKIYGVAGTAKSAELLTRQRDRYTGTYGYEVASKPFEGTFDEVMREAERRAAYIAKKEGAAPIPPGEPPIDVQAGVRAVDRVRQRGGTVEEARAEAQAAAKPPARPVEPVRVAEPTPESVTPRDTSAPAEPAAPQPAPPAEPTAPRAPDIAKLQAENDAILKRMRARGSVKGKEAGATLGPEDWADMLAYTRNHIRITGMKFADWADHMRATFGDWVNEHLDRLWAAATKPPTVEAPATPEAAPKPRRTKKAPAPGTARYGEPADAVTDASRMRMRDIEAAAEERGMPMPERGEYGDTHEDVKRRVNANYGPLVEALKTYDPEKAPALTTDEQYAAGARIRELFRTYQEAQRGGNKDVADVALAEIDQLSRILHRGGSEAGRMLEIRKMFIPDPTNPDSIMQMAEKLADGEVSRSTRSALLQMVGQAQRLKAAIDAKVEARTKPEAAAATEPRATVRRLPASFGATNKTFTLERRDAALKRLQEKFARTSAGVDPTLLGDLMEVGGFYVEGGLRSFTAWANQMRSHLPGLDDDTLAEVWRKLRQKPITSAELERRAEKALATIGQKVPRRQRPISPEVAQAELDYAQGAKTLKAFAARVRDRYGEKLGPETIQKLFSEAAQRYKTDYRALDDIQAQMADTVMGEVWRRKPFLTKAGHILLDTPNMSRAVLTSFDVSAPGRQGLILTGRQMVWNPRRAFPTLGKMFQSLVSEDATRVVDAEIHTRPNALNEYYDRAKLYIAERGTGTSLQEEAYRSQFAERIPIIGRYVKASERAYTTYLNRLRADTFDVMVGSLEKSGRKLTDGELLLVGNFINAATGRGKLGTLEASANGLGKLIFSPRNMASRFQIIGMPITTPIGAAKAGSWRGGSAVARAYLESAVGMGALYGLLMLAGGKVSSGDPSNTDFGKVQFGNTVIDPTAGLGSAFTFMWRLAMGRRVGVGGKETVYGEKYGTPTRYEAAEQYIRGKFAPMPGAAATLLGQRKMSSGDVARAKAQGSYVPQVGEYAAIDVTGMPTTAAEQGLRLVVPMSFNDIREAAQHEGLPLTTAVGLLSLLGFSVQPRTGVVTMTASGGSARMIVPQYRPSRGYSIIPKTPHMGR